MTRTIGRNTLVTKGRRWKPSNVTLFLIWAPLFLILVFTALDANLFLTLNLPKHIREMHRNCMHACMLQPLILLSDFYSFTNFLSFFLSLFLSYKLVELCPPPVLFTYPLTYLQDNDEGAYVWPIFWLLTFLLTYLWTKPVELYANAPCSGVLPSIAWHRVWRRWCLSSCKGQCEVLTWSKSFPTAAWRPTVGPLAETVETCRRQCRSICNKQLIIIIIIISCSSSISYCYSCSSSSIYGI